MRRFASQLHVRGQGPRCLQAGASLGERQTRHNLGPSGDFHGDGSQGRGHFFRFFFLLLFFQASPTIIQAVFGDLGPRVVVGKWEATHAQLQTTQTLASATSRCAQLQAWESRGGAFVLVWECGDPRV